MVVWFLDTESIPLEPISAHEICKKLFSDVDWRNPVVSFELSYGVISISVDWYVDDGLYESCINRKVPSRYRFLRIDTP